MIKKTKLLIYFLIFILFANCSFHNTAGIWSGEKEEKRIAGIEKGQKENIKVVKVYSSKNIYAKEISSAKSVNLNKPKTNSSWKMSNLNLQNFIGNIYLSGISNNFLKKKIGKNKFSLSKIMASPLVYNDNIILSDDTG